MLNSILCEFAKYHNMKNNIIWPELDYCGEYKGYSNNECEKDFGFECINIEKKIGYRYSYFFEDEIDALLLKGQVDEIRLVIWDNREEIPYFDYADSRVLVINFYDMFCDLRENVEDEETLHLYELMTERVTSAVEQANALISLVTLPGFTPSYIHKTRDTTVNNLVNTVLSLEAFYVKEEHYKSTQFDSSQLITDYHLQDIFVKSGFQFSFIGKSTFAKSFMTSEYLYTYFKKNSMFDYTPIVSGYLKSVEQLLDAICVCFRNSKGLVINMGNYTLGSYTEFIDQHPDIFKTELHSVHQIIVKCLESYRIESRNHLFHRDYFNTWERVEIIRKNTIFLYMALLSSVDTELLEDNNNILRYINRNYEDLFNILDNKDYQEYYMVLQGIEYSRLMKLPRTKGLTYDKNGLITNPLSFRSLLDNNDITISSNNMPSEIWSIDKNGNKDRIL